MKNYQFASVNGPEIIDVTADSNGEVRACSKGMSWVHMMTHRYGEITITALRHALASTHIGFELACANSVDDSRSSSSIEHAGRRIVDLNDDGRTMLRMLVAEDGSIVQCEGPMAFIVEGLNEIMDGQLSASQVAELLDLGSDVAEYGVDCCPPLPLIAAALGELLRQGVGPPQTPEGTFIGSGEDGEDGKSRRIR